MKTDDAVLSFLKSIYMTLVHVYGCTVLCTQTEKKIMMKAYDAVMGKTTDSLIGPQPAARHARAEESRETSTSNDIDLGRIYRDRQSRWRPCTSFRDRW
jgi:hypothetical protein